MMWPKMGMSGSGGPFRPDGAGEANGELAYIGLGSNLGDREGWMARALALLQTLPESAVVATSRLYESAPRYVLDQPAFLNAVVALRTSLAPHALLEALLAIEQAMGRVRAVDKGPRNIDLDLLLYGEHGLSDTHLTVPHPGIAQRAFVLAPLAEIAPGRAHPQLGATFGELLEQCPDRGWLRCLEP